MPTEPVTLDPTPTPPATLADLAGSCSMQEYRAVRQGHKSVREVVEARETPPSTEAEPPPDAAVTPDGETVTDAAKTLAARKTGLEKRKASLQAEINAIVREREDNKRLSQREKDQTRAEIDALKAELATLKGTKPGETPPTGPRPAPGEAEPTPDQFETYEQFVKAQARWEARQEVKAALDAGREAAEQRQRAQAEHDAMGTFEVRKEAARAKHADFDEVVAAQADLPMSPAMKAVLVGSDQGAELVYYLASHPEEAKRIAALPPVRQIHELGKLESRLEAVHSGPAAPVVPISKAPAPIKPVGGDATTSSPSLEQVAIAGDMKRYRSLRERRA